MKMTTVPMDVHYHDNVHRKGVIFWKRARIWCITWFCLLLGSLPAYYAQDLPISNSTPHFSNTATSITDDQPKARTGKFINVTEEELRKSERTDVEQDFPISEILKNLTLQMNNIRDHYNSLYAKYQKFQNDINNNFHPVKDDLQEIEKFMAYLNGLKNNSAILPHPLGNSIHLAPSTVKDDTAKSATPDDIIHSQNSSVETNGNNSAPISWFSEKEQEEYTTAINDMENSETDKDIPLFQNQSMNEEFKNMEQSDMESLETATMEAKFQNDSTEFGKDDETFVSARVSQFDNTSLVTESVASSSSRNVDEKVTVLGQNSDDELTEVFNPGKITNQVKENTTHGTFTLTTLPPLNLKDGLESTYTPDTNTFQQVGDLGSDHNNSESIITHGSTFPQEGLISSTTEKLLASHKKITEIGNITQVTSNISHGPQDEFQIQNLYSEDGIRLMANTALKLANEDMKFVEGANRSTSEINNGSFAYTRKRICFQNLDLSHGLLASSETLFSKPVDMYMYYRVPTEEQTSQVKHQYTKDEAVDKNDTYGAYSLHNHKVVSRYVLANGTNTQKTGSQPRQRRDTSISNSTEARTFEPDIFCIEVATTTQVQQKSSPTTNDEKVTPDDSRMQKFYYKKKMPFLLDNIQSQTCEISCDDKSACITKEQICDDIVQCRDLSDERNCTCKERMDINKICDGYSDCPNGEDEDGCNDCPEDQFACTDSGQKYPQRHCIPMSKRCDDIFDCADRDDEQNCEVLTETVVSHDDFTLGYTNGYLHRNWRGKWYPVCEVDINYDWAVKACASEIGTRKIHVEVELLPYVNDYAGYFISKSDLNGRPELTEGCGAQKRAVHVKCPPIPCGSRMPQEYFETGYRSKRHTHTYKNPFRVIQILKNMDVDIGIIRKYLQKDEVDYGKYASREKNPHTIRDHPRYNNSNDYPYYHREDPKVVEGKSSAPAKWPWLVAIFKNGNFHCGGTILDENWIMTAAHCVYRYDQHYYEVRAGVLRRLSFSPSEQIKSVAQIILHPNYVNSDMQNDLALLRLESPLNYNRWVRPICLPEARPPWGPKPGTFCTAVGWGTTMEKGSNPDNLREVELPVLTDCKHLPDKLADEICAGYPKGGGDTCQGDSGGPLLCRIQGTRDRWYVAGVVSHGEGCDRPMEPGAYTRVALYIPWLMENTDYNFLRTNRNPKKDCPGIRDSIGRRCIPVKKICDGVIDCLNAEDELGCLQPFDDSFDKYGSENDCDKQFLYKSQSLGDYKHELQCKHLIQNWAGNHVINQRSIQSWDEKNVTKNTNLHSDETAKYPTPISYNKTTQFLCDRIVQVIPRAWHCDGDVDCEDGTDEMNCTCSDFLKKENESLICDGIIHCYDASDEKHCLAEPCNETQFNCYRSHICIDRKYRCNGTPECSHHGEDEENCYAIFPFPEQGLRVELNYFDVPAFAEQGILVGNKEGIWKPICKPSEKENNIIPPRIIPKNLQKLHFKVPSNIFHTDMMVINDDLQRPNYHDIVYCNGIRVDLSHVIHTEDYNNLPWLVDVYINGEQRCIGFLVRDRWIIADFACCRDFNATKDIVVAVMGDRNSKSKVRSPYQQMILADKTKCHNDLKIMEISLKRVPNITAHTRVLQWNGWLLDSQNETDVCYLLFNYENSISNLIEVKSYVLNCPPEKRCYYVENKDKLCKDSNHSLHLNGVVCTKQQKWYLSSTVVGRDEIFCSSNINILKLDYLKDLRTVFVLENESHLESSQEQQPDFLCDRGNSIPGTEVCDGKLDCWYGEDETGESCSLKDSIYNSTKHACGCKVDQFKCGTGKCISKAFICDGENDCTDGSDEPEQCKTNASSCAVYLNLTNPSKLCDLQQDCYDKSDERSSLCPSNCDHPQSFNCSRSNKCVPLDFTCDGERDCPGGEDEEGCRELRPIRSDQKGNVTVWTKTRGNWHEECVRAEEYTGLKEDELCERFGFSRLLKSGRISSRRLVTHDPYTKIRLNNGKEIQIKNHRQKNMNVALTEDCENFNLYCEIKNNV